MAIYLISERHSKKKKIKKRKVIRDCTGCLCQQIVSENTGLLSVIFLVSHFCLTGPLSHALETALFIEAHVILFLPLFGITCSRSVCLRHCFARCKAPTFGGLQVRSELPEEQRA